MTRRNFLDPNHSAFTLPLRTAAASMNLTMEAISISSSFAPPLPETKRLEDNNAKVYNANELAL